MSKIPEKPIYVTRPSLPPLDDFVPYLETLWEDRWLTNNGQYHVLLETKLARFLGVKYVSLFANGTIALVVALKALDLEGEVITTPYSFVATSHAIRWNGLDPVFCDVDPQFLNLDPALLEARFSKRTTAIMPVHVYGNPCDVETIDAFAREHGLKVIYDAAHAFGVARGGESILNHGDLSVLSFHATKIFNTMEGGAIISHDAEMKQHIDYLKNFGFRNEVSVVATGINGKMNEMQAALGLAQLDQYGEELVKREALSRHYRDRLADIAGISVLPLPEGVKLNFGYLPIFIDPDRYRTSRDVLYNYLRSHNVWGRRYFYPLISDFPGFRELPSADRSGLPVAARAADGVICLPLYGGLAPATVTWITDLIRACPAEAPPFDETGV